MKSVIQKVLVSSCLISVLALSGCSVNPERVKAGTETATGSTQEFVGTMTDNSELKAKGKKNKIKGRLRNTKENIKDVVKDSTT